MKISALLPRPDLFKSMIPLIKICPFFSPECRCGVALSLAKETKTVTLVSLNGLRLKIGGELRSFSADWFY